MVHGVHVSRKAEEDILGCMRYLSRENVSLPARFLTAFEKTCTSLLDMPYSGEVWVSDEHPLLLTVRKIPLREFKKYLLFYRENDGDIEVVRVLHGARNISVILGEE